MVTICKECGHGSELGHIFCTSCGARLELTNIGEGLELEQVAKQRKAVLKVFGIPALLLIVIVASLVFWPGRPFEEEKGSKGAGRSLESTLFALNIFVKRPAGELAVEPPLRQVDVNEWLKAQKNKQKRIRAVSVEFGKDKATLRLIQYIGPFAVSSYTIPEIPYSFDLLGTVEKGELKLSSARVGHLPLIGPPKDLIAGHVGNLLKGMNREKDILNHVTDIKLAKGKLSITIRAGEEE